MRILTVLLSVFLVFPVWAAKKTYQVTGPITEITASKIVVQKGKDRWEIDKDGATRGSGNLKVGDKVTVEYTMLATNVDLKPKKKSK